MAKIMQFMDTKAGMMVAAGGVVLVAAYLIEKKARNVAVAVNPVNRDNVFYSGVNAVGETLTGDEQWSLGGAIYDEHQKIKEWWRNG